MLKTKRNPISMRSQRGAALVEAAFVIPVLLLLVFGMIDIGLMIKDSSALHQVAREAARSYAVGGTPSVTALAAKYGITNSAGVSVTNLVAPTTKGAQVSISLSYTHQMIFLPGPKTLTAGMVMRRE